MNVINLTTLIVVPERKGKKFILDLQMSSFTMAMMCLVDDIIEFSTIGDCNYLLQFSRPNCLKLTRKPAKSNQQQQSTIFNLELHEVTVSDSTGIKKMPKISVNQWGPIYVSLKPRLHVVLDYEQPNNSKIGILNYLAQLLNSGIGSDVEFIVKGEKIQAHTLILRGGISPVFTAMFEHDMIESSSRTVIINDVEPTVFRQLLRYLYTDGVATEVENDANMVELLFIAADKYQVNSLKDWCIHLLSKALTEENAVRLLVLAHLHSAVWLQEDCIDLIVKKKTEFFNREDLMRTLAHNYPDVFFEIAQRSIK